MHIGGTISGEAECLTPVQAREQAFYDQYSQTRKCEPVCFDPILGREQRPWNSYWEMFRIARERFQPGMRLLDFGCGWGVFTVVFARIGFRVDGFDVSPGNVQAAHELAERYDMAAQIAITRQTAEQLEYADETFDVVAGFDILHHVDIRPAIAECHRVLKTGGVAIFREPLRNVVLDWLRNTAPARRVLSNEPSLARHITHDEEKLSGPDLAEIRRQFPHMRIHRFQVLSRLAALHKPWEMSLERVDYALRRIPGYQRLAGSAVLELTKE